MALLFILLEIGSCVMRKNVYHENCKGTAQDLNLNCTARQDFCSREYWSTPSVMEHKIVAELYRKTFGAIRPSSSMLKRECAATSAAH